MDKDTCEARFALESAKTGCEGTLDGKLIDESDRDNGVCDKAPAMCDNLNVCCWHCTCCEVLCFCST